MNKFFERISSDISIYHGFKFFGVLGVILGFFNPVHWILSAMCFAAMLFIGKPEK